MKISTWNLMRPTASTKERNVFFKNQLLKAEADVLVLTETNEQIAPGESYNVAHSIELPPFFDNLKYDPGERRVSLFSKYPIINSIEVGDPYTSVCKELATPAGPLIIYGTIIGVTGGKDARFKADLERQQKEIAELAKTNRLCVAGDFNISFSGYPYPGNKVRNEFLEFASANDMVVLTKELNDVPDHIMISKHFLIDMVFEAFFTPVENKYSDHGMVTVVLKKDSESS